MSNIAIRRLHNQGLAQQQFHKPGDVVAWLGAVQAQEYALAKWALGLRMENANDDMVEQAFSDGAILRTHLIRPTWHFVTPEDIRWLLALTAPRVNAVNAFMYRKLELDDALFLRSNAAIAKALVGGKHLTREELASVLAEVGIVADGMRLGYIVHRAELDAIVCSGPRRGKQFTYALLEERVPPARVWARAEALAELTRRYFTSHGPAMVADFARWSGLTQADAKAGIEMSKPYLVSEVINSKTYWYASSSPTLQNNPVMAHLLPIYDEYTIAFKDHSDILDPLYAEQVMSNPLFTSYFAVEGQLIGMWRRTFTKGAVVIESAPLRPFTAAENDAFAAAAQRFGAFMGMSVVLAS